MKYLLLSLLLIIVSCAAPQPREFKAEYTEINPTDLTIEYAYTFLDIPYIWNGDSRESGLDCSGFVIELLKFTGVVEETYDSTARGIFFDLRRSGAEFKRAKGSISFYGKSIYKIRHVGFHVSPDTLIEAAGGNFRTIRPNSKAKVRLRPYQYRSDYLISILPLY